MRCKIFFEDSDYGYIPPLLRKVAPNDVELIFVGGSGNFVTQEYMEQYTADINILFHDVVPDNFTTLYNYKGVCKRLRTRSNVYVFPIISLEYSIVKFFVPSIPLDVITLSKVNYSYTGADITSLEQYLKYLLNNSEPCLRLDSFDYRHPDDYSYYTSDCSALRCNNNIFKTTLLSKAWKLYYNFPVTELLLKADYTTIINALSEQLNHYNSFASEFMRNRLSDPSLITKGLLNPETVLHYHKLEGNK